MARTSSRPAVRPLEDRTVPAAVAGQVFADVNADGVRDAGEVGLVGVTVQLDSAADGVVDATLSTNALGEFSFGALADGTHTVVVLPPAGTTAQGPTTRVVTVSGGVTNVTVGLVPQGKVVGLVFADLNANGKQDAGEPGLANATVTVDTNGDGGVDYAVVTQADGAYAVTGVPDGVHKVAVVPPVNYLQVTANPLTVSLAGGREAHGTDFALRPATAVAGQVRLFGVAGAAGVPGVTVQLDVLGDGKVDYTTTTNGRGDYLFANVPSGTHVVRVVGTGGAKVYGPADGDSVSVLVNGDVQSGYDFGITFPGSVSGGLFMDLNGNDRRDDGEVGLTPGRVRVNLYGSGTVVDVTARATGNGSFVVSGLPDGEHVLEVTPAGGYAAAGQTWLPFTITGGGAATVAPVAARASSGSTLTVAISGFAQTYNFTPTAGGGVSYLPGRGVAATGDRVVSADFNGDGVQDIITGTGAGTRATVRVYDGATGAELVAGGIQVFEGSFNGGVNLAAGDFNLDGKADIVVAADTGGGPRVQVLNAAQFQAGADPARGKVLADFLGIEDVNFRGGTRVAAGDVNADGTPDLVVAAGQGGGPRVAVFTGTSLTPATAPARLVSDFFVFEAGLRNGATVAVGDVNGDGFGDLVAGAGPGGAPRVTVFSGAGVVANQGDASPRVADFFVANETGSRSGTRLAVKDIDHDGKGDLIATNGSRAYAYTSAGIAAYYVNPTAGVAPGSVAELVPFAGSGSLNVG